MCHHLAESLLLSIPWGSGKSVLQTAFWQKQIWKVSGLQEHLLFTFTAWLVSSGAWGRAFHHRERTGCAQVTGSPGHTDSLLGWPTISRGLRKAQEGNAGNTRLWSPTPSHPHSTTASSYLEPPSGLEDMEMAALAAKGKGPFTKASWETRSRTYVETDHVEYLAGFPLL